MPTAALPIPAQNFVMRNIPWTTYVAIGDLLLDQNIRMNYDRGVLEFMMTSPQHEHQKTLLGRLVETLTEELNVDIASFGSMTFRQEDAERGMEPDECYWIEHEEQVRGRTTIDFDADPPPEGKSGAPWDEGCPGCSFAADNVPNLAHLRARAEREGTANVVPILASFDNPRLPARSVDVVLLLDTYHHIDDRREYFRRVQDALEPGGRVVVVDFRKEDLPVGPPSDHKIAREQVISEMTASGYALASEPDVLPYQYFLVFQVR